MLKLNKISIHGFKSIDSDGQTIDFGDVTVLIGPNGAGKSNLVSFFKMLNHMMTAALQIYIGLNGSAYRLLHFGPKKTRDIWSEIEYADENSTYRYQFSLTHAPGDTLIFRDESVAHFSKDSSQPILIPLGGGKMETKLLEKITERNETCLSIYKPLTNCGVYQFHDTTQSAKIRNQCNIREREQLYDDAGNLAAILYAMKNSPETRKYYYRIVGRIAKIFPQFRDFELTPSKHNDKFLLLNYLEAESTYTFDPSQLSDGTLRFMALTTLLLQPPDWLPKVIIIDEPELGLHPTAIDDLASMVRTAAENSQVVLCTQSTRLLDELDDKEIVVVERDEQKKSSVFKRLDKDSLSEWLSRYSMSELLEKNVIGGNP
jgi:predicted ATPase